MRRAALCIGIDEYPFGPLQGCVNDAQRISSVISKHDDGSPNFDCREIIAPLGAGNDQITRVELRKAISELFRNQVDVALFHYSGHGTVNNLDGYLVTQDAEKYDEGVPMNDVLRMANESQAAEVVIFLDCCHSGVLGNLPEIHNSKALLHEGVSILTASRSDQPSVEVGGGGLFSSLVADALRGGAADILGNVTAPAIYSYVEAALGAWQQRPLFKSHVSQLSALRKCDPPIDRTILRNLPYLFPLPAEDLPLDPSFELTSEAADPDRVSDFKYLQALNRSHLVIPCGSTHMYDAAVDSHSCKLTPTGRYYWRLADDGLI